MTRQMPKRMIITGPPSSGTTYAMWLFNRVPGWIFTHEFGIYGYESSDEPFGSHKLDFPGDEYCRKVAQRIYVNSTKFENIRGQGKTKNKNGQRLHRLVGLTQEDLYEELQNIMSVCDDREEFVSRIEEFLFHHSYYVVGDKMPNYLEALPELTKKVNIDRVFLTYRDPWKLCASYHYKPFPGWCKDTQILKESAECTIRLLRSVIEQAHLMRQKGYRAYILDLDDWESNVDKMTGGIQEHTELLREKVAETYNPTDYSKEVKQLQQEMPDDLMDEFKSIERSKRKACKSG